MPQTIRIAADIGGTFTDIALMTEDGTVATWKLPSTPDDYGRGVIEGIRCLSEACGFALGDIREVLHGCTVATNAILEGKGARTALITTQGFRDVLELRRIRVPRLYRPLYVKPEPLVSRDLRLEVSERISAKGKILVPLGEGDVGRCIEVLKRERVEAVAVCFLHSYANPDHERRVGEILRDALPDMFVTLSVDILPEIREYERTSTAVINSYVGPVVAGYVSALDRGLKENGIGGRLLMMQSSGGMLDAKRVLKVPALIVECGPAAGVIGAAQQAGFSGYANVITLDMGGTTAKASLIEGGEMTRTDEYEVGGGISVSSRLVKGGGYALKLPVIDISEVGAGGGSIVWFDKVGVLKVGPQSAGAVPGPACYGAGGIEPTVTDANVVLGYINPDALAGGTMPIDAALGRDVVRDRVAARLDTRLVDAAWAVHMVTTSNMMRAVKAVSTYRGRNPADFVLMAFGGNGGIFAAELARQLQIGVVVVPPGAGVFSAIGLNLAETEFRRAHAFVARVDRIEPGVLNGELRKLEDEVAATLDAGRDRLAVRRIASMRYAGQAFELPVPLPDQDLDNDDLCKLARAFEAEHERSYGHRLTDHGGIDIIALEVIVTAVMETRRASPRLQARRGEAVRAERQAYFGDAAGLRRTPVLRRCDLDAEPRPGPLIVEEYEGTTVVPPWATARLDLHTNIVIEIEAGQ